MNPGRRRFLQAVGLTPLAPKAILAAAPAWRLGKVAIGKRHVVFECLTFGAASYVATAFLPDDSPAILLPGQTTWLLPARAYAALRSEVGL
jgi:hypothetical protein